MPLNVYYLDDEPALLEIFAETFGSAQIVVTTFLDPKVAIEAIKAKPPDVVFLDYRLPNTTGDKIALSLEASLTKALITGDLNVKCEARFDAIFEKPYKDEAVEAFLEERLRLKSSTQIKR